VRSLHHQVENRIEDLAGILIAIGQQLYRPFRSAKRTVTCWAFALDSLPGGFGFAFTTREMCEALHQEFNGYSTPMDSACESVSIKLLDAPLD
jgi:hypothetical protein